MKSNVYTFIITIFLILVLPNASSAQVVDIRGSVKSQDGTPIPQATIVSEGRNYTVSSDYGFFILNIPKADKVVLSVRSLGYEPLDTILTIKENTLRLDLVMKERIYEIKSVDVQVDRINIFEETNKYILDFEITNDYFIHLYKEDKEQKIGLFDFEGNQIDEYVIDSYYNFKKLTTSCTGTIIAIGRKECKEFFVNRRQLDFLGTFTRDKYDQVLAPCVAEIDQKLYLKEFGAHNKIINYIVSASRAGVKKLFSVIDSASLAAAEQYYNDILIAYTNFIRQNYSPVRQNHYDILIGDDLSRLHLVNENLWGGNLLRLIVDDTTDQMVPQYLQLEKVPIKTKEFVIDHYFYVMSYVDRKILRFNTLSKKLDSLPIFGISWDDHHKVLSDKKTSQIYFMQSSSMGEIELDSITINPQNITVTSIGRFPFVRDKKGKVAIHNHMIYYLTHGGRFRFVVLE